MTMDSEPDASRRVCMQAETNTAPVTDEYHPFAFQQLDAFSRSELVSCTVVSVQAPCRHVSAVILALQLVAPKM